MILNPLKVYWDMVARFWKTYFHVVWHKQDLSKLDKLDPSGVGIKLFSALGTTIAAPMHVLWYLLSATLCTLLLLLFPFAAVLYLPFEYYKWNKLLHSDADDQVSSKGSDMLRDTDG